MADGEAVTWLRARLEARRAVMDRNGAPKAAAVVGGILAVLDEHAARPDGYCRTCCEVTRGQDAKAPCRTVRLHLAGELGAAPLSAVVDDLVGEGDLDG